MLLEHILLLLFGRAKKCMCVDWYVIIPYNDYVAWYSCYEILYEVITFMKKLFVVLFAAVMMSFSLVACGDKKEPAGTEQTVSIGSPEEVINQIYAKKTVNLTIPKSYS